MLTLTSCPECHAPAEITGRFTMASTDGPVAHVAVSCLTGHHYRMPADKLPVPDNPAPSRRLAFRPNRLRLCVRCQANPAGFWVSASDGSVTRARPAPRVHDHGQFWALYGLFWPRSWNLRRERWLARH